MSEHVNDEKENILVAISNSRFSTKSQFTQILKNGLINEDVAEFVADNAGNMKINVVWDTTLYSMLERYDSLRDLPFLSFEQETEETLGINIVSSTKTSRKSTRLHGITSQEATVFK